jgi:sugar/nucleoside kinase (ribokinase family)
MKVRTAQVMSARRVKRPTRTAHLLAVGTVAIDCVENADGERNEAIGGSASFIAAAAAHFCPVQIVGVIGEDFPETELAFFRSRGIDTSGISRANGKTFRWHGRYEKDPNVRHTIATDLNVLKGFQPELPPAFRKTSYVALGNIDPELQLCVLDQIENPRCIICDTMNYWIEGSPDSLRRMLRRVQILSVNDSEARQLSGEHNLVKAAQAVRRLGPEHVVIKRGENGAALFSSEGVYVVPAVPLESVIDPTGAGDSFAGGMMGYIARTGRQDVKTLRQAMVVGSVIASFAVEKFSIEGLRRLTHEQINARYSLFRQMTFFERKLPFLLGG